MKSKFRYYKIPGNVAYGVILFASVLAAFWGAAEFFHEGWFEPYGKYLPYYLMPSAILIILNLLSLSFPRTGGVLIIAGTTAFLVWRYTALMKLHYVIYPSFWIMGFIFMLPGILFIIDGYLKRKHREEKPAKFSLRTHKKFIVAVVLPVIVMLITSVPLLKRNLNRIPLEDYNEIKVRGNGIERVLAGQGPGWLFSNKNPIVYKGKKYSGLSWNEIALFGKAPIGFEHKRYGLGYNGSKKTIYYATQNDFENYNMFRYIDSAGAKLTDSIYDYWRLPSIDEYVRVLTYRDSNSGGKFDYKTGEASYKIKPDKDAPVWAPDKEVIYYWSATSANDTCAYDITYSGQVRKILKTVKQDYRGFRAVRVK